MPGFRVRHLLAPDIGLGCLGASVCFYRERGTWNAEPRTERGTWNRTWNLERGTWNVSVSLPQFRDNRFERGDHLGAVDVVLAEPQPQVERLGRRPVLEHEGLW